MQREKTIEKAYSEFMLKNLKEINSKQNLGIGFFIVSY